MRAYAVLDGGGVKGAALAGCLDAAADQGIEFVGYGGTSAGAIVALLASVGYNGRQICCLMKGDVHPKKLLDDDGVALQQARQHLQRVTNIFSSDRWLVGKAWDLRKLWKEASGMVGGLWTHGGLYDGQRLRKTLFDLIQARLQLPAHTDVTFEDLKTAGCPELKIVASDITDRRVAVFARNQQEYGRSVIEAVRASASYPFLFRPVPLADGRRLADGGLSSNLPAFLFAEERELTQYPVLAFDLVASSEEDLHPSVRTLNDLLSTALEAGNELMVAEAPGVWRIPIPVPPGITTLKFDLSPDEIEALFRAGQDHTMKFLHNFTRLQNTKKPGLTIQKELEAIYGDRKLFEPPLWALANLIQERTKARQVRAQIMLPTGRQERTRIVTYYYGFRQGDGDADLELPEFTGCTGRALKERGPVVADLQDAKTNYERWYMLEGHQRKVAADRQAMLSVPIFAWSADKPLVPELPIIGILSVDSSTPLGDTGWVEEQGVDHGSSVKGEVSGILIAWANVISKLLR